MEKSMRRAGKPKRAQSPKRYDDVEFDFFYTDGSGSQTGSVVVRDTSIVIDIPDQAEVKPCLIEGTLAGHVFAGRNSRRSEEPLQVQARWTDLGDRFVGVWIEEGTDMLFSFRLPKGWKS
jgi:hypothetical protein